MLFSNLIGGPGYKYCEDDIVAAILSTDLVPLFEVFCCFLSDRIRFRKTCCYFASGMTDDASSCFDNDIVSITMT